MKKSIVLGLLFVVLLPCFAWAGDIDGIWVNPDMGISAGGIMVRENGGTVIAVALVFDEYDTSYCAHVGTQTGNTITLQDTPFCSVSMTATITLSSETTATVKVNHCSPKYSGVHCIFPTGVTFNIEKAF